MGGRGANGAPSPPDRDGSDLLAPPARVTLEGVSKRFGNHEAVRGLDLDVAPGEFMVLLGPSGCGKSTVLRLIAGLEEPDEGKVRIGDEVVNDVEPRDRDVAMVFQSYALYPHLSVRRNIEFPLRSRGAGTAERTSLVAEAARSLQLDALLDRKPGQLSGGQRQRVALARAIVRRPRAFLMDEPLSNLDARLRVEMRAELVELHRRLGTTVVYVTHDQVEAMTMGERIAVMSEGELQQVGPPKTVHDLPANVFVAGFIGSPPMNLLPGELVPARHGPGLAVGVASGVLEFPADSPAPTGATAGRKVVAGVRPEDMAILAGERPAHMATIEVTVSLVEALGHEFHVACRDGDGRTVTVRLPASAEPPAVGDVVRLEVRGALHVFDEATGRRLDG